MISAIATFYFYPTFRAGFLIKAKYDNLADTLLLTKYLIK